MKELEEKLGYHFRDKALLANALTHSSYANEKRADGCSCNERLEFLGDSVLGFVTAAYLYAMMPPLPEGRMTKLRAELVCETALHRVALQLELGKYLRLGRGEERTGGRARTSILADAVEAVIAAMYLDGGFDAAKKFILEQVLAGADVACAPTGDWKTELQEYVQQKAGQTLSYELLSESGPDHSKVFVFCVRLNGGRSAGDRDAPKRRRSSPLLGRLWRH